MKWFMDTEFSEDGRTIELISIALVGEDGSSYYAHSSDYDPDRCSEWVRRNVLPHLEGKERISRQRIAGDIRSMCLDSGEEPEFWAYFADYDWVALCQLYGSMEQLPEGFPMYCRDLKQLMDERGITKDMLPAQPGNAHDALADALWVREAFLWIKDGRRP